MMRINKSFLLGAVLATGVSALSWADNTTAAPWAQLQIAPPAAAQNQLIPRLSHYGLFKLNESRMISDLALAPLDQNGIYFGEPVQIQLPRPDGTIQRFWAVESPILSPELQAQHPEVKTYCIKGIDDPTRTGRIDFTANGFSGMILGGDGQIFIDPIDFGDPSAHTVYFKKDLAPLDSGWRCGVKTSRNPFEGEVQTKKLNEDGSTGTNVSFISSGTTLRTYRLALNGTAEYTAARGGTVPSATASMITSMNRVNGVYEVDVAIRMTLVQTLPFTDTATDGYTNNDGGAMLSQNQSKMNVTPGSANYDIGHVFSTGGGGVAGLGVVGGGSKAWGVTGQSSPTGDAFDIDYVAHEMGHQFRGNHSFQGTSGACSGNKNNSTAWEPGSASTIMGYAGICGSQDLQSNSDAIFHGGSRDEILNFVNNTIPAIGTTSATGNNAPVVNAGPDYAIPLSTPFRLTATATDPDGDTGLTYIWEQRNPNAALFRSFQPLTTGSRTFPRIANVLSTTFTSTPETLPSTARTMVMRCTVRDNRLNGGGTGDDETNIQVSGAQFKVNTADTAGTIFPAGSTQTITWTVGGSAAAPVNCANVRIVLSTIGGTDLEAGGTVLVASTPNDGSETVTLPFLQTVQGRIKIEAIGNVFFDINGANFSIDAVNNTTLTLSPSSVICGSGSTGTIAINTPAPAGGVTFNLTDNSSLVSEPASVTILGGQTSATFPITTTSPGANGSVTITATGPGTSYTKTATLNLTANVAPVAVADGYSTPYLTTLNVPASGVLANDSDPNVQPITAVLQSTTANGVLSLNANGSFTYTPNSGFSGNDSFTYQASDGSLQSSTVTVTINVGARPKLQGTVNLGAEFVGNKALIPIVIEVRNAGTLTVIATFSGNLNASGGYSFDFAPPFLGGTYDVAIKCSHWLRKVTPNVAFSNASNTTVNTTLINGDCDGNNNITTDDYLVFSAAFDTNVGDPGYDAGADLNGDGSVTTDDYLIFSENFDTEGDA